MTEKIYNYLILTKNLTDRQLSLSRWKISPGKKFLCPAIAAQAAHAMEISHFNQRYLRQARGLLVCFMTFSRPTGEASMVGIQGYGNHNSYASSVGSIAAQALAATPFSNTLAATDNDAGPAKSTAVAGTGATHLSSGTLGSLLSQQETGATSWDDGHKEWPEESMRNGIAQGVGDGYFLSSADKEMIKAATGFSFNADGLPCDDSGKAVECPANDFIGQIALERQAGVLSGPITPGYLQDLYSRFASHGEQLNPEWLTKSLNYLATRNDG